jgi:hypothetical protein
MNAIMILSSRTSCGPQVAIALLVSLALSAAHASAQHADLQLRSLHVPAMTAPVASRAMADDRYQDAGADWHALRVAKWTVAAATAGTALYGFVSHNRADDLYRELELMCVADAPRCLSRTSSGAYTDAELEARYQEMRDVDRRARSALLAGQVGVAASVVLFILDLRNRNGPANIPYEPPGLSLQRAPDGGYAVGWRLAVSAGY